MESVIKTAFPFVVISVGILLAFQGVLMIVAYTVLAERKVLGWMQGRIGPNRVGPWGVLQPFADLLKFIFKEDIVPDKSTRFIYFLAPMVALVCAIMPIVVYPFGPAITTVDWSFFTVRSRRRRPHPAVDDLEHRCRRAFCPGNYVSRGLRHRPRGLVIQLEV